MWWIVVWETIERENKFLYEMNKIYWCENDGEMKCTQNIAGDKGWDNHLHVDLLEETYPVVAYIAEEMMIVWNVYCMLY